MRTIRRVATLLFVSGLALALTPPTDAQTPQQIQQVVSTLASLNPDVKAALAANDARTLSHLLNTLTISHAVWGKALTINQVKAALPSASPAPTPTPVTPPVDTTHPTPTPTPTPSPSGAYMQVRWSSYANTSALVADCTHFECENDHINVGSDVASSGAHGDLVIDPTVTSPNGDPTLRYHYNHGTGNGCTSITVGRDIRFPSEQQEVWAEFYVKYSTNFTDGSQNPQHACDPNDHKLIFGLVTSPSGEAGRYAYYIGSGSDPFHDMNQERPTPFAGGANLNRAHPMPSETIWSSGTWHTVRLHMKNSSSSTSNDGAWEIWFDGALIHQQTGFSLKDPSGSTAGLTLHGLSLGRNMDDGPPNRDIYLWWGPVTVYTSNPGW